MKTATQRARMPIERHILGLEKMEILHKIYTLSNGIPFIPKYMLKLSKNLASDLKRRGFLKSAGVSMIGLAGVGAASLASTPSCSAMAPVPGQNQRSREERMKQMASNSYAVNRLFKRRQYPNRPERPETTALKEKYGEITLLDFPQFSRDTYPGVPAMDLWSSLFGDIYDNSMFVRMERNGRTYYRDFDPGAGSAKAYLDKLANKIAVSGLKAVHISNNAPRNLADLDEAKRMEGIRVGKLWLDVSRHIGVQSMRCNTGGPRIIPTSEIKGG